MAVKNKSIETSNSIKEGVNVMKLLKAMLFCSFLLIKISVSQAQENVWNWESGPYVTGFQLVEEIDFSRFYPSEERNEWKGRPIRIYFWYPAKQTNQATMEFRDYVGMAAADFSQKRLEKQEDIEIKFLPVQLSKGLKDEELEVLMKRRTQAVRDASFAEGNFPLLILGQGLYYESPLSHVVLCEFLASHGYVVAACPLLGTQYRLVNLSVEDLETEIRDMEFVLGVVSKFPQVKAESFGVIGYDLGGMAGLILAMRNPGVTAFLSLDAGILFGHSSGLPNDHPHYHEGNFTIPWMHVTQARFIKYYRDDRGLSTLMDRKQFGDSLLLHVSTENHGEFTSYSMFGLRDALAGYWGPWGPNPSKNYEEICLYSLFFFDAYLKKDRTVLLKLQEKAQDRIDNEGVIKLEFKQGQTAPPSMADLVHLIIEEGLDKAKPIIYDEKMSSADSIPIDETILNWLGYHFLYWWGREEEALDIFKMNVSLFPKSANAYDSLGEAYLNRGDPESAIRCYRKSLELNPENTNASEQLKRLVKEKK